MIVCSVLLLPAPAEAQSGGRTTYLESRLSELQRTAANLSAQLEQLKVQDRQLQQQMEKMQTSLGQRLERLEKGGAAKPAPRSSPSKR